MTQDRNRVDMVERLHLVSGQGMGMKMGRCVWSDF